MRTTNQQNSNQQKCYNNVEVQTRCHQIKTSPSCGHQNYVPFLGKTSRFAVNKYAQPNPPIGSYNLPSCFDQKQSYLQERVNQFVFEAERKKQQMCIFKSSMNRFEKVVKDVPGPAAYNLFKRKSENKEQKIRPTMSNLSHQKKNIDLAKTCPSIPHKENKYGYSITNGKVKNIEKNSNTLEKQKKFRKQYLATLDHEGVMKDSRYFHSTAFNSKKKLYGQTLKVFASQSEQQYQKNMSKTLLKYKKPKYQHLYHSKGVEQSNPHEKLGPGTYDVKNNAFNIDSKQQKYQFFGSTEVRFKEKTNQIEKGYPLIEIAKQNKKITIKDTRPSPMRRSYESIQNKSADNVPPGPGQYNPHDELFKKSRGKAFFPNQQRFQGVYSRPEENYQDQQVKEEQFQKKAIKTGKLKKQRFKPLQKVYDPVNSAQICGILSEKRDGKEKKTSKRQNKIVFEENDINSWSRQGKRSCGNEYLNQLKEQLAYINQSSRTGSSKSKQFHKSNKNHKKD